MPTFDIYSFMLWILVLVPVLEAALFTTVGKTFSTSFPALFVELASAVVTFCVVMSRDYPRDGGLPQMLNALRGRWKQGAGAGLATYILLWTIVFVVNLFTAYRDVVSSPPSLAITLKPVDYTSAQPGQIVSGNFLRDRQQYDLILVNTSSKLEISQLDVLVQFPYPVETSEIVDGDDEVVTFKANVPRTSWQFTGGASVQLPGKGMGWRDYTLRVGALRPSGRVKISFVLNSERDPRGKTIPEESAAWFFIPRSGPSFTFIVGSFHFSVGDQLITRNLYAPMWLDETRRVVLGGVSDIRPHDLSLDMQLMSGGK